MTRLLTSTLVLGAALSAALISAPAYSAESAAPKSVAVATPDAKTLNKRQSAGTAPEIVITGTRPKTDSQVADSNESPTKG